VAAIPPCERDLCRSRRPPFGVYILVNFRVSHCNT
jgi:hypothetical protein